MHRSFVSSRFQPVVFTLALGAFVPGSVPVAAAPPTGDAAALLSSLRSAPLDPAGTVRVDGVRIDTGLAQLHVERGVLVPVEAVAGPAGEHVREVVFSGRARLVLEPPDAIEAGQLDLFTGSPRLDEVVTAAVLTVASDRAAAAIFGRPASAADAETEAAARERLASWRESAERRYLGVDDALLLDALGEPGYDSYFAGWFAGEELGEFLYVIDPDEPEQVTLGRFVQVDVSAREKRKLERELGRQQRRGRLIGLSVDDLGEWDTWLSAPLHGVSGSSAFEPTHYELDATLDGRKLEIAGRARITLQAVAGGHRAVGLSIHPDLRITAARDAAGAELLRLDGPGGATVLLPEPVAEGATATIEVDWEGNPTEKLDTRSFVLRDTIGWHPHTGTVDRATYDLTLRWPSGMDLVATGRRVDSGKGGGERWERRVVERPTFGVSFEVGSFESYTRQAGGVTITLYVDHFSSPLIDGWREELLDSVAGSLDYYGEAFGAYPSEELTVVTSPRLYSQSLVGYVTLSSLMVGDLGGLSALFEDRRTVIAHEVAHQWWGHAVGWQGYRDQWISEAMANYAALLYARHRLEQRPWRGPTTGWQSALTDTTEDGRSLESIGPVVLGERLASTRAPGAYTPIVYQKGAVVVDMIARIFGEETFVRILGAVVKAVDGRSISTEDFVALIEKASGAELDPFVDQFVYGTGLPEVYYRYDFEPAADGKWTVRGVARQQSPYRYTYRVVDLGGGRLDVAREAVAQISVEQSRLVVPVQIEAYDPAQESGGRKKKARAEAAGNTRLQGHTLLEGSETEFALELPLEPVEVFFDRENEVFGRFFNERRHPKRMAFYRGLDRLAENDVEGARAACEEALAAPTFAGADLTGETDRKELEEESRLLDARIRLHLARVHLRASADGEAAEQVGVVRGLLKRDDPRWLEEETRILEARLALRRSDAAAAYDLLRKKLLREAIDDVEGSMVLAIAARGVGDADALRTALEAVEGSGADVTLLRED